jgi:hypothetical protein
MFQYSPLEMSEEYQRVIRCGLLMFQYSPLEMSEEYQRVIRCGLLMFQYSPLEMSEEYQSDQTWIIDVPILSTRDE